MDNQHLETLISISWFKYQITNQILDTPLIWISIKVKLVTNVYIRKQSKYIVKCVWLVAGLSRLTSSDWFDSGWVRFPRVELQLQVDSWFMNNSVFVILFLEFNRSWRSTVWPDSSDWLGDLWWANPRRQNDYPLLFSGVSYIRGCLWRLCQAAQLCIAYGQNWYCIPYDRASVLPFCIGGCWTIYHPYF